MEIHSDGNVSEFDSDDDIPLSDLQPLADFTRWTSRINTYRVNEFSGQLGLDIGEGPFSFLDYFYMMFSGDFFQTIAGETKRYAQQSIQKNQQTVQPDGNYGKGDPVWKKQGETTATEMKAFLSTVITMGISNKHAALEDILSTNDRLGNRAVQKVMPINRWRKLNQYIHLVDNELEPDVNDPDRDRLFKVRHVLLNAHFKNGKYKPNRKVSIDEAMIGFKGRSFMKQYMPGKPTKWGLKSWMLADSCNDYCLNANIYTGAKDRQGPTEGLGYQVVMALAEHVAGKNIIYFLTTISHRRS